MPRVIRAAGNGNERCNVSSGLKFATLRLIVSMELLLLLLLLLQFVFAIGTKYVNTYPVQYVAVIDAGSTGSRIQVYKFQRTSTSADNQLQLLNEELYRETKPGLSSYIDNPADGVLSINRLLQQAYEFIPQEHWNSTPLALKATAGMRLVSPEKANNLLNALRDLFASTDFNVANPQQDVEIMDGSAEGIFSWFTVNYLLRRFSSQPQQHAAALDLGGGSTQVTFTWTNSVEQLKAEDYLYRVLYDDQAYYVFSQSYLRLGLQAARYASFNANAEDLQLESICLNQGTRNSSWFYRNREYLVSGKLGNESAQFNFNACQQLIKSSILPLVNPKPFTLQQHELAAFSYYFVLGFQSDLVDPIAGGATTVQAFHIKARQACAQHNAEHPFMCFDLTYIYMLLHEGFDLPDYNRVMLYNEIDGHSISWALGCAFHMLGQLEFNNSRYYADSILSESGLN